MKLQALFGLLAFTADSSAFPQLLPDFLVPARSTVDATPTHKLSSGQPTLEAVVPREIDTRSKKSLELQRNGQLFYQSHVASENVAPGTAARLTMNFQYPSLILDHARETYDSVLCNGKTMSMTFHSKHYYEHVKQEWTQHEEMVVITSSAGCKSYTEGHHVYFKATHLKFTDDKLGLSLTGEPLKFEEIIEDAHLEFGEVTHTSPESLEERALSPTQKSKTTPKPTATTTPKAKSKAKPKPKVNANTATSQTTLATSTATPSAAQCGNLPSATISGIPAASCGAGFDQILDSALGYYSFSDDDFANTWAAIAPGASLDDFYDDPADLATPPARRAELHARGIFHGHFTLANAVKSIAKATVAKVASTVQAVKATIASIPGKIVSAAKAVYHFAKALVEGHPSVSLSLPLRYSLGGFDSSPWGPAKLLHLWKKAAGTPPSPNDPKVMEQMKKEGPELLPDNLDDVSHVGIYCVNCGFNGTFNATGAIGFSITGIHNATLDMVGDLDLNMNLGLDALAIKKVDLAKKRLFNTGVPGFSIPDILALGPVLYVEAGIDFEIKAIGQLLAGTTIAFRNAHTHMDFLHPSNGYSKNWKPTFNDSFSLHGELSAALIFELPIGVMFGLDILNGKFKESLGSLVDSTSLEIEAKIELDLEGSISGNTSSGASSASGNASINDGECYGVAWDVSLHNQLNFDILKQKNFKIFEVELPIATGCIGYEPQTAASTPSASPKASLPGVPRPPGCSGTGNVLTNGDFSSNQLSPWYVQYADPQNTVDTSNGFVSTSENSDPNGNNPYSTVHLHQDITLCVGTTYTFSFDYQFNNQPYDIYTYGTILYPDGTGTGVFGDRSYGDNAAIGQWEHYSSTFVATQSQATFEILTVACAGESTISSYDNFVIAPSPSQSKRSIDSVPFGQYARGTFIEHEIRRRQDQGNATSGNEIQLNQTADGSNEDNDDTPDPDNIDPFNANGTVASSPDDSDLDIFVDDSESDFESDADTNQDFGDLTSNYTTPAVGTQSSNSSLFPTLPDADDITLLTLPSTDGSYQLSAGSDGNVYLEAVNPSSTSGLFAASNGIFAGDFQSRFFHLYSGELQALNVSRLRLSDTTNFPQGALVVGLVGVSTGGTNLMVASDTNGNIYYLAACNLQGQDSKVFLVQDPDAGLQVLQSAVASWTITGGIASNCSVIGISPPSIAVSL